MASVGGRVSRAPCLAARRLRWRHELDGMAYSDLGGGREHLDRECPRRVHRARASLRRRLTGIGVGGGVPDLAGRSSGGLSRRKGVEPRALLAPRSWRHLFSLGDPTSARRRFGGSAGGVSSFNRTRGLPADDQPDRQTAMASCRTFAWHVGLRTGGNRGDRLCFRRGSRSLRMSPQTPGHRQRSMWSRPRTSSPLAPQSPTLASSASPAQQAAVPTSAGSA